MAGFLTQLVDGVRRGFKGAAKSALAYYDGSKWTAKEAGDPHQILSLDENGDLEWITASYDYVPLPVSPQNGDMLVYQDGWKKLDKGTAGQILGMTATLPAFKDSATHLAFCIKTPVDNDKSVKYVVREPLSLKDVNIVFYHGTDCTSRSEAIQERNDRNRQLGSHCGHDDNKRVKCRRRKRRYASLRDRRTDQRSSGNKRPGEGTTNPVRRFTSLGS